MPNLVIMVRYQVVRGRRNDFLADVRRNAATSVANEPGCRVAVPTPDRGLGDEAVLHEVYDSSTAFEAHQKTPHLADFRDATEAIVTSSAVGHFLLEESDHVTPRAIRRTDSAKLPKAA